MAADRSSTLSLPGAYARELARTLGIAGFWRWWVGQLAALVPAGPRAAWQRRRLRPVIAFEGARASLWRPVIRDGQLAMAEHAAVALEGGADEVAAAGRGALAALARAAGNGNVAVTLALPPRTVLRKQLLLPLAVEENLRQVIGYDLDRHTPFKADELYYDAVATERDPVRSVVRVDLATARRSLVDPLIAHAEAWGATVAAVSADPAQLAAASPLNLLPPERRPARAPWRRWQFWLPVAALALVVLAATVLPVWQKREYAIELGALADRARAQAAISETLRAELERQVGDYNFALARKFGYPPTVQVIDDVTRIMPDDTWLTQFELRTARGKDVTRELSLRGESANAGRLVTVLEDSRLFTQAAPRSPTTKIQPGPGEIFDVGAQLKPLPPPTGAPLVIAAGATPVDAPPSPAGSTARASAIPVAPPPAGASSRAPSAPTPPAAAPASQAPAAPNAQAGAPAKAAAPSAGAPAAPSATLAPAQPANAPGAVEAPAGSVAAPKGAVPAAPAPASGAVPVAPPPAPAASAPAASAPTGNAPTGSAPAGSAPANAAPAASAPGPARRAAAAGSP